MLSSFFPADRLESYRTSPYKDRIDQIGQRLVEQRYHPEVTAQHLREWLRVTRYLQAQELRLPLALDAPEVGQYVTDRVIGLSASRTRFVWAAVRIFLDADEALRLTLADVDLETAVLRIRDTKFGKSRLVPLAADVAARLARCRHTVADELGERTPGEPFFPAPSGRPYSLSALRDAFHAVLAAAEIPRRQGGRSLRLHGLRHSFAVLRLTLWYRQQASLGNLLPALATYLGHVGIASSQRYLQLTEDVAADLTHRYATRFGHLVSDGGPR